MWRPIPALEQSWLRTKATDLAGYLQVASRQANSSNDTIFADAEGEIVYLHPQFVPVRSDRFDYTHAVDGSDPATDWHGLTPLAKLPQAIEPASGYVFNTNNWPWSAAGPNSLKAANFPRYMDANGENARGLHAAMLLEEKRDWTAARLMTAAYDSYHPAFASLLPPLVSAYDALPNTDARKERLAAPVELLRDWNYRWSANSTATSLAVIWGDTLRQKGGSFLVSEFSNAPQAIATSVPVDRQLTALSAAVARLTGDFGDWRVEWRRINRFQRLDDRIEPHFDDALPSTPVPFTSAQWGSLASFGARAYPNTTRYYGTSGNSFVAVVEFGPRVKAWAVSAGGESGDSTSPHFRDQIDRYATCKLRSVYFYPEDMRGHIERTYQPETANSPRS